jgi:hypothetical protein
MNTPVGLQIKVPKLLKLPSQGSLLGHTTELILVVRIRNDQSWKSVRREEGGETHFRREN